jgi:hypothetical protein
VFPGAGADRLGPAAFGLHLPVDHDQDHREEPPGDPAEKSADGISQFGIDEREPLDVRGQAARERLAPHPDHPGLALPGQHGRPGIQVVARRLGDGTGLPREQGLVDFESVLVHDDRIGRHQVACPQHEHVVDDHIIDGDLAHVSCPQDTRAGRVEQGEPIKGALRAILLNDPDDHVGHGGEAEQRVLPLAEQKQKHGAPDHDRVEHREQVGAQDVAEAPTRFLRHMVGQARGDPGGNLIVTQPD